MVYGLTSKVVHCLKFQRKLNTTTTTYAPAGTRMSNLTALH